MSKSILLIFALFAAVGTTFAGSIDNCTTIDNCQECVTSECHWIQCQSNEPTCQLNGPTEMCAEVSCDDNSTTTVPPPTTEPPTEPPTTAPPTTEAPTTTEVPTEPPTTEAPTTETPTETPTEAPTTEAPTPTPTEPPTTPPTEPPTEAPTDPPTTETPTTTTAAPPTPSGRHFDAASFFGGMVLAVGIMAVAYAAWRFYKSRNGRSYHTL